MEFVFILLKTNLNETKKKLYTKLNKIYKMSIPKGKRNINRIQIFIINQKTNKK